MNVTTEPVGEVNLIPELIVAPGEATDMLGVERPPHSAGRDLGNRVGAGIDGTRWGAHAKTVT